MQMCDCFFDVFSILQCGYHLYLYQAAFGQSGYSYGAACWEWSCKEGRVHLVQHRKIGHVGQENGRFDHMTSVCVRSFQDGCHVLYGLFCLAAEVCAGKLTRLRIDTQLAAGKQHSVGCNCLTISTNSCRCFLC